MMGGNLVEHFTTTAGHIVGHFSPDPQNSAVFLSLVVLFKFFLCVGPPRMNVPEHDPRRNVWGLRKDFRLNIDGKCCVRRVRVGV